jgi:hypothetical protein
MRKKGVPGKAAIVDRGAGYGKTVLAKKVVRCTWPRL